jgi:predicted ATPase
MSFTLKVRNYRGLRQVDWSPEGVCALVGPNGSGKTTLLRVLDVLREALDSDFLTAIEKNDGPLDFRHRAAGNEPVEFEVGVTGGTSPQRWLLKAQSHGEWIGRRPHETVFVGEDRWAEREAGADHMKIHKEEFPCGNDLLLRAATKIDIGKEKTLAPLQALVSGYEFHSNYRLHDLKSTGSPVSSATRLSQHGSNAFTVLQHWHGKRADPRHRFEFVIETLKSCFPDFFRDLEFTTYGQRVTGTMVTSTSTEPFQVAQAPDGWLTTLLHLTALVSCPDGGVVAIDEPENALHPFAIRRLLEAMREWSGRCDVTVLLATHSPVLLDCFDDSPDQVFVMEPNRDTLPVALDALRSRDWLSHFKLGTLYGEQMYGAPNGTRSP